MLHQSNNTWLVCHSILSEETVISRHAFCLLQRLFRLLLWSKKLPEQIAWKMPSDSLLKVFFLHNFGHIMRAERSLERDIMLGKVEGHRKQGKPRMRWLDSIKEATGLRLEDLKEAVQGRKKWRTLVEEKTRNRVWTNVKWIQEKAMANHSCTAKLA